ncbi:type IVB secretion system protein IcmH/DotU [Marinobacter psychrophilus]|jgi:type VI secretion system protein ImpK|uniref:type IVB secretion system protein IcmH/DotU n=1 Tax=Marinobacter psychrophilus TaxID=330734 RepID=UPI001B427D3B|nr:type IVB secretion system protein IcmH/DotU [Marinobacter psychrophilus]MBQ0764157.1 type IVB secretion system protein IcmH/DotU [Marinobacter psychrophilus]MBQ0844937.1 type IVB secretion system protein IcmH/DotU [Marinobacter psychrophilus]
MDNEMHSNAFSLRGLEPNPLIDAAAPLLGLVIRIRRLADYSSVESLYHQVLDDITVIERELMDQGYEHSALVSYRYVLCAFIDEAMLGTQWGAHSVWSQQSLLSRFHNETWGGEKVFGILARMEQEPERYQDMLAFIYLCLCLGFEGRYKVMTNGRDEYNSILRGLGQQLATLNGDAASAPLADALKNRVPARSRYGNHWPLAGIGLALLLALGGIFHLYSSALDERVVQVHELLEQLPR